MNPDEGERELDAAIREGAVQRVRPKAMTVEVILAGLFPIPVGTGAGSEVRSLAISHQPVAALDWPAMTMSFMAPGIDLDMLMKGDHIQFDFNSVGMDGTVTRIERSKTP